MVSIAHLRQAVQEEQKMVRTESSRRRIAVEHYERRSVLKGEHYYEIWLSESLRLMEEATVEFVSARQKLTGTVVRLQENQNPIIKFPVPLTEQIYRIHTTFNPNFIIDALDKGLATLRPEGHPLLDNLLAKRLDFESSYDFAPTQIFSELNPSQQQAMVIANCYPLSIIWGPPGTGKTKVLACMLKDWIVKKRSVLVVSISNVALDQVLIKFHEQLESQPRLRSLVSRLGNSDHPICSEYIRKIPLLEGPRVIFSTLAMLGLSFEQLSQSGFNTVVVDEASMVPFPQIALATSLAHKRLVIAGDFYQLPPVALSPKAPLMHQHVFSFFNIPIQIEQGSPPPYLQMLDQQYRMTAGISQGISDVFYHSKLFCAVKTRAITQELVFIDVDDTSHRRSYFSVEDRSYFNPVSLYLLQAMLHGSFSHLKEDLYVLTPYRAQQNLLNNYLLDQQITQGRALTIHKSQGAERDYIFLDLTTHGMTQSKTYSKLLDNLSASALLNVALSRARRQLLIVGSGRMFKDLSQNHDFYQRLWNWIEHDFEYLSAQSLLDEQPFFNLSDLPVTGQRALGIDIEKDAKLLAHFQSSDYPNRYYFSPHSHTLAQDGITYRTIDNNTLPHCYLFDDLILLRQHRRYQAIRSHVASKSLIRLCVGHLLDTEEDKSSHTHVLHCEKCRGNYIINFINGLVKLQCDSCKRQEVITLPVARSLKRIYRPRCPECHADVEPRTAKGKHLPTFYGCTNYPHCKGVVRFYELFIQ